MVLQATATTALVRRHRPLSECLAPVLDRHFLEWSQDPGLACKELAQSLKIYLSHRPVPLPVYALTECKAVFNFWFDQLILQQARSEGLI